MPDLTAKRTLVKSPPELWEELSEVERLGKHLGAFGEITITKLEPEHTVAWEGERASGTVSIEPSGWGTKVTLRAELPESSEPEPEPSHPRTEAQHVGDTYGRFRVEAEREPAPEPEPAPETPVEEREPIAQAAEPAAELPAEPRHRGFWAWLFRDRTSAHAIEAQPIAEEPPPEPVAEEPLAEPVAEEPPAEPAAEERAAETVEVDAVAEPPDDVLDPEHARVILDEALDTLGAAHHRPFSRG